MIKLWEMLQVMEMHKKLTYEQLFRVIINSRPKGAKMDNFEVCVSRLIRGGFLALTERQGVMSVEFLEGAE